MRNGCRLGMVPPGARLPTCEPGVEPRAVGPLQILAAVCILAGLPGPMLVAGGASGIAAGAGSAACAGQAAYAGMVERGGGVRGEDAWCHGGSGT